MADPPETAPAAEQPVEREPRRLDRKTLLPVLLIAAVIIVPVAVWAIGAGGGGDSLRVEQYVSYYTGGPEIVIAIPRKYNNMAETGNKAERGGRVPGLGREAGVAGQRGLAVHRRARLRPPARPPAGFGRAAESGGDVHGRGDEASPDRRVAAY